jgi:hypothetical protein
MRHVNIANRWYIYAQEAPIAFEYDLIRSYKMVECKKALCP